MRGSSYGPYGPDLIPESPWLNLYATRPRPTTRASDRSARRGIGWTRRSVRPRRPGSCRSTSGTGTARSIYLSLGSLGSADVALMQRLVDLLATTEHRVIVSKGPLADQIALHDNQAGEGFLPQPAILPEVDLVITHGGNNTVTEAFHHGKPMIVLPLFWDQVDNAQRIDETGFGRRLADLRLPRRGADRRHRRAARGRAAGSPPDRDVGARSRPPGGPSAPPT